MTKHNHKCEDIKILLGEMLLGTLPKQDERIVEEHLLECAACRGELKELRSFYGVIGEYRLLQPDPAFSKRMKAAVFREMQNEKQPRSERNTAKLPWYKRPRLVLGLTTVAAVGISAIVYVAISPYLSGLGTKPDFPEDSVAGGGVATLSESPLPYTPRSEGDVSPSVEMEEEPAPKFMTRAEEASLEPASVGDTAIKRGTVPDKYAYWESTLGGRDVAGGSAGGYGSGSGTIASTTASTGDSQASTDFDEEYLKAMHSRAESFGTSYAGTRSASGERLSGRWGSWSHPDVGIETTSIGGIADEGYMPMDDDIYSTLLELSPEERERVLEELDCETEAIK